MNKNSDNKMSTGEINIGNINSEEIDNTPIMVYVLDKDGEEKKLIDLSKTDLQILCSKLTIRLYFAVKNYIEFLTGCDKLLENNLVKGIDNNLSLKEKRKLFEFLAYKDVINSDKVFYTMSEMLKDPNFEDRIEEENKENKND